MPLISVKSVKSHILLKLLMPLKSPQSSPEAKIHFMVSCLVILSIGSMVPRMALRNGTMPYTENETWLSAYRNTHSHPTDVGCIIHIIQTQYHTLHNISIQYIKGHFHRKICNLWRKKSDVFKLLVTYVFTIRLGETR